MSSTPSSTARPRFRSSTIGSIQNLTRALRETLRIRRLRKQKRRNNEANSDKMRRRSKSVGNDYIDDEISEIGISVVVASDIGPIMNSTKRNIKNTTQQRRQSKSVDDVELAEIRRQLDREKMNANKTSNSASGNGQMRRRSKDDHDLPKQTTAKSSHYYINEQKGFRKRFRRLFGSLKTKQQTHTPLASETPSPSSPSTDCEDKAEKTDITADKDNNELKSADQ